MVLNIDHGSEAKAGIKSALAHRARLAEVRRYVARHKRDENGEHADEERRQARVEDGVEEADFSPARAIAAQELSSARIPYERLFLLHVVVRIVENKLLLYHCYYTRIL